MIYTRRIRDQLTRTARPTWPLEVEHNKHTQTQLKLAPTYRSAQANADCCQADSPRRLHRREDGAH